MGIQSALEYVDFFINLNMGENVSLLSFVNNEKIVLKQKLEEKISNDGHTISVLIIPKFLFIGFSPSSYF